jgi:hypothetical protein
MFGMTKTTQLQTKLPRNATTEMKLLRLRLDFVISTIAAAAGKAVKKTR